MLSFAARKLASTIVLLFLVALMVYGLVLLIPGDPAVTLSGENATEEQIQETRERLNLDDPLVVQFGRWVGNAVQGDLGTSLYSSRGVTDSLRDRFPVSLSLALAATAVALLISIPAGILAALRRGTWVDRAATLGASVGVAVPSFWLGLILVLVFAVWNDVLPSQGYVKFSENAGEWLRHIILPAVALGGAAAATIMRQLRSALVEALDQDYIRTARAKGLRSRMVIGKHALKNAAVPVITVLGIQVSFLVGGSAVVEQVFGIPGIGSLAVTAVYQRDVPMIMGVVVAATLVVVLTNLLVDLSYAYFNPKVRAA